MAALDIDPVGIKSIKPRWKRTQYRAVLNWLMEYKPQPDATNLEQVRGYLEAFHHLCEVSDWERASLILRMRINTPTLEELHNQLGTWGYYREQVELYSRLLGKLNYTWDTICLNGLGYAYYSLGDYPRVIDYSQQALAIARKIGDRDAEASALIHLGDSYNYLGDPEKALSYHQQALNIVGKIGNSISEAIALAKRSPQS